MKKFKLPPKCSATTSKGRRCRFAARRETGLCINHDPSYREQQEANRSRGIRMATAARQRPALRLTDLDLTDRTTVQAFLDAIIRLELGGHLSEARARRLVRLASLAIKNFDTPVQGRRASHDAERYEVLRASLDSRLGQLCELAEQRDAARREQQ